MENTLLFEAEFPSWRNSFEKTITSSTTEGELLSLLSQTTYGVDGLIGVCLQKLVDFPKIDLALKEIPLSKNPADFGKTLAAFNTRGFSKIVNELADLPGLQKKEQGEMAQFIRLYCVRRVLAHSGVYLNYSAHFSEAKPFVDGKIQLIANYDSWKAVKKMVTHEKSLPRTTMEFLGSFSVSMENKLESYLKQVVDMKKMDELIKQAPQGKTAGDLEKISAYYASDAVSHAIDSLAKTGKGIEPIKLSIILRVYLARKLVEPTKQFALYAQVEIPGLKRLLKKKA